MKNFKRLILITTLMGLSVYSWAAAETNSVLTQSVLQQLKQKQRIYLVDIRQAEEFEAVRIPDSINVPLYFIKTKAFLKKNPVVLVDGGYPDRQTEVVCRELSAKGFAVSILSGGLLAWQRGGGQLNGDLFFLERYKQLSALKFHQEKDRKDQVVIDVSEQKEPQAESLFPGALHLPYPQRLTPAAVRGAATRKKYIVILTDAGKEYERIEKVIAAAGLENVFYLEGGLAGYQAYLSDQALARQDRDSRIRQTADCVPCGQKNNKFSLCSP